MIKRISIFVYGVVSYLIFLACFLYSIGFLGNFGVPRTMDGGPKLPLWHALTVDLVLLGFFALQHSGMARPGFKRAWTRLIPVEAERSTYVLMTCLMLFAMFWLWAPIEGTVWSITDERASAAVYAIFGAGWVLLLIATFLINHFDLFGLRQAWLCLKGEPYRTLPFRTPALYRMVRHPLYVAWLMIFWATPVMTSARLLFAVMTTAYILLAIQWEESDLIHLYGEAYRKYRREVPMLIPRLFGTARPGEKSDAARAA